MSTTERLRSAVLNSPFSVFRKTKSNSFHMNFNSTVVTVDRSGIFKEEAIIVAWFAYANLRNICGKIYRKTISFLYLDWIFLRLEIKPCF